MCQKLHSWFHTLENFSQKIPYKIPLIIKFRACSENTNITYLVFRENFCLENIYLNLKFYLYTQDH